MIWCSVVSLRSNGYNWHGQASCFCVLRLCCAQMFNELTSCALKSTRSSIGPHLLTVSSVTQFYHQLGIYAYLQLLPIIEGEIRCLSLSQKTVMSSKIKVVRPQERPYVDLCDLFQNFRGNRLVVPWILIYRVITTQLPHSLPVSYIWPKCSPYLIHTRPHRRLRPRHPPAPLPHPNNS